MNHTIKQAVYFLILLFSLNSAAQLETFDYSATLEKPSDQWHSIALPNEVFEHSKSDFSDIRIYGVNAKKDTLEVPYMMRKLSDKNITKKVDFKIINKAKNAEGYLFTFEIPSLTNINQMVLDFNGDNFDRKINLEGSNDQKNWFSVIEDYRILSIRNEITDYQFTTLRFPESKYRYFRVLVKGGRAAFPEIKTASITNTGTIAGTYRDYKVKSVETEVMKKQKLTKINIAFESPVLVSDLTIAIKDTFDYYRAIRIQYLLDSTKTDQGWQYNYRNLTNGVLSSLEEGNFSFTPTLVRKIRILVNDRDNRPLNIGGVSAKGYVHELLARFDEPADYFLAYGNKSMNKPSYDISRFTNKIPESPKPLSIKDTALIPKEIKAEAQPLFQNKIWLWLIMGVVIFLLGGMTMNMMKKA